MKPELPLLFTPMQAVAWVMFRDPAVVSMGAALPADPQRRVAELKRREEAAGWIGEGDKDGALTLLGLDLHAIERMDGPAPEIPGPKTSGEAAALLVEALRNGRVTALANHRDRVSFEQMPAVEWMDLTLDYDPHRHTALMACYVLPDGCPSYQPSAWLKVSIDRDPLMAAFPAWPVPASDDTHVEVSSLLHPGALPHGFTLMEVVAWIMFRSPDLIALGRPLRRDRSGDISYDSQLASLVPQHEWHKGLSTSRLQALAEAGLRKTNGGKPPSASAAQDTLLAALRCGAVVARGKGAKEREPIPAEAWKSMVLASPLRHTSVLTMMEPFEVIPSRSGAWTEIQIDNVLVRSEWPDHGGKRRPIAANASGVMPVALPERMTAAQAIAWIMFRDAGVVSRVRCGLRTDASGDLRVAIADAAESGRPICESESAELFLLRELHCRRLPATGGEVEVEDLRAGDEYAGLSIASADLLRLWPGDVDMSRSPQQRDAEIGLLQEPGAPTSPARDGFMWAADALRLLAFGAVVRPKPDDVSYLDALDMLAASSRTLCHALAHDQMVATGRPGNSRTGKLRRGPPERIPDLFFQPSTVAFKIDSWAVREDDEAGDPPSNDEFLDWGEVQLREEDIEKLRQRLLNTGAAGENGAIVPSDGSEPGDGVCLDERERKALDWMTHAQMQAVAQHGRPKDVRSLGREMKIATKLPARLTDKLYGRLPLGLRNAARQ